MSFILLGILNSAAAGGAIDSSFDLLESETLDANASSFSFTNINTKYAADYQHLQVRFNVQTNRAATLSDFRIRVNGDTGTNQAYHQMYKTSTSSVSSSESRFQSGTRIFTNADNSDDNAYGSHIVDIYDPFLAGRTRTMKVFSGLILSGEVGVQVTSGFRNNTAALSSLTFYENLGNAIRSRSHFALYGIKAVV